jgi:hypothetical protein
LAAGDVLVLPGEAAHAGVGTALGACNAGGGPIGFGRPFAPGPMRKAKQISGPRRNCSS